MINVRKLGRDDVALYREVRLESLRDSPSAFGSTYEESVGQPEARYIDRIASTADRFMLGAWDGDRIVGLVSFRRHEGLKVRHRGEVNQMYVRPDYRGRRIGRLMLEVLLSEVRGLEDVSHVELAVESSNLSALGLYRSLGFETYGRVNAAMKMEGRFYDEILMVLTL